MKRKMQLKFSVLSAMLMLISNQALLPACASDIQHTPAYHKEFKNAKHWSKKFDDPERDAWQMPDRVIEDLQLTAASCLADLGAGTGYFSIRIAESYPKLKVLACDSQNEMIEFLQNEAKKRNLNNLNALLVSSSKPELPESCDLILLVNTLHHIDNRSAYLKFISRNMPLSGRIAVIDFKESSEIGPPKQFRIPKSEMEREFKSAGFELEKEFDYLPKQHFLIFKAKATK